jgi:hypothetical protein
MTRRTLEIVAFFVALLLGAMSLHAWLASRDEQQRLASTLASQKQLLDAADARERSRETALDATLAQVEQLKRTTQTPEQILRDLPKYLRLPQPITLAPSTTADAAATPFAQKGTGASPKSAAQSEAAPAEEPRDLSAKNAAQPESAAAGEPRRPAAHPSAPTNLSPSVPGTPNDLPSAPAAQIPIADLKPLYDYVQDCRACQAQLAAAKQNQSDEATKIAALTRERDAAITASKGGTFLRRLRRNALWFAVGAAVGAAAGAAARNKASLH